MFNGIVESVAVINNIKRISDSAELFVSTDFDLSSVKLGDSIAICGCCLSVTSINNNCLSFDVSSETLRKTKLGQLKVGVRVNLERSMRLGDQIHGHLVTGHIDGLGKIVSIVEEGNTKRFGIEFPKELAKFIAPKGSISVDGVSLTVGEIINTVFYIYIIPITSSKSIFSDYKIGDLVNIEVDLIARYVCRASEVL